MRNLRKKKFRERKVETSEKNEELENEKLKMKK